MKTKLFVIALVATILGLTSCSSVKQTAPVMALAGNSINTHIKADIDFEHIKRIKGGATTTRVLWIFNHTTNGNKKLTANNKYKGLSEGESIALYRAKTAADVDVVLEPQFDVETKSYFFGIYKRTKVNVVGWGANIKGFSEDPSSITNTVEPYPSGILGL